jgi:uncharacterized protein YeaO (DUF488 family)
MEQIYVKRVYEEPEMADGYRILVDRLWPRGISKEKAALDQWAKNITPSTLLRNKIHSGEIDWNEFAREYEFELDNNDYFRSWRDSIFRILEKEPITLLTAAKLGAQNHGSILKGIILNSRKI